MRNKNSQSLPLHRAGHNDASSNSFQALGREHSWAQRALAGIQRTWILQPAHTPRLAGGGGVGWEEWVMQPSPHPMAQVFPT